MYSEIASNKRKTWLLLIVFLLLIASLAFFMGVYFGDYYITIGALLGATAYALFSYFGAAKTALSFNGASEIKKQDNPRLWRIVENLSITEGLPMPKVYIIEDSALNAFATGRDPEHAAVAITTGLLDNLSDTELEGVMAHELGHVKNYDIRVSMVVFGLVIAISILADIFLRMSIFSRRDKDTPPIMALLSVVAMLLAPFVAAIVQAAISRKREFLADATGAMTTRYPEGLASALEKIKLGSSATKRQHTASAHLFFANPMRGKNLSTIFSTHPPIDERIARLREMGGKV